MKPDVGGGHPFYLQLLGETLVRQEADEEGDALKQALQGLVFSRTGRLALYFENELQRLVGRSGHFKKSLTLQTVCPISNTTPAPPANGIRSPRDDPRTGCGRRATPRRDERTGCKRHLGRAPRRAHRLQEP